MFTIGYSLTVKPMNSRFLYWIENINEVFLLISAYFIIVFSFWLYIPEEDHFDSKTREDYPMLRYRLGFVYLAFLLAVLAFNLIIILS